MSEHVVKRGNRYYYRRRVPVDLVDAFGKSEHQQALGSAKRSEADKLARQAAVELDRIFDKLRAELNAPNVPVSATPDYGPIAREAAEDAELDMYASAALFEEPLDVQFANHDEQLAREARQAQRRQQRVADMKEAIRGVLGDTNGHAPHIVTALAALVVPPQAPTKAAPAPLETRPMDRSLDTLARLWEKDRQPESRAALAFHRAVDRFHAKMGRVAVPRITKAQIVALKDALEAEGVGPTSVDQTLNNLRTLFTYAIGKAWIETNPATGVKREGKKKHARTARPPFDLATLNRIFAHRIYTEDYRPEAGRGEAAYWLPLLGLYTGARVEELCQLSPDNVHEESYRDDSGKERKAWVMQLINSEEHGQSVKNSYSVRRIPVHQELIRLGFVKYARAQTGKPRIFHELRKDKYGVESSLWSAWWIQRMLRAECKPTSPKMVFHSFRHTFKDVCRECGITKEIADALQGHSEGDASSNYGGEFFPLRPLVGAMASYAIHGLKLPG
ncbi:hypothetical protein F6X40_01925 [Paraburkholderia sp. UCT31]|uniref:tyrosine-type recombinase/integrase n=1 Tax=Paraburkholderia sp. UCT31 TaxID=2615209 RepID=UPI00165645D5|nr:tyrosine-type recombinase/integrase [Paraburkholderia sp. UCT31]MBC8735623.1 hypothetical protein [Paraburkholderia sp. UCT31]